MLVASFLIMYRQWVFACFFLLLSIMTATVGIFIIEQGANKDFSDLFESLWWTIVTITTVGYGDHAPVTIEGKVFAIFVISSGVIVNSLIISLFSQLFFGFQSATYLGIKPFRKKGHLLICSDDVRFIESVIHEYPQKLKERKIVIVAPSKTHPLQRSEFAKLPWIAGHPSEHLVSQRAGAANAKEAYVFFRDHSETTTGVIQLKSLSQRKTTVAAIDYNLRSDTNFRKLGCDRVLNPFDIFVPMMVRAFLSQESYLWARKLILRDPFFPQIQTKLMKKSDAGLSWKDYFMREKNHNKTPIAVLTADQQIHISPPHHLTIHENDSVLSLQPPKQNLIYGTKLPEKIEFPTKGVVLIASDSLMFIRRLLAELEFVKQDEEIMIISQKVCPSDFPLGHNIQWVNMNLVIDYELSRIRPSHVKVAFLDHRSDSYTMMCVLVLEALTQGVVKTVASFRSPEFANNLEYIGCDFYINADELSAPLLAQSLSNEGYEVLIKRILTQKIKTNSLRLFEVTDDFQEESWLEISSLLFDYDCIALAVARNGQLFIHPANDLIIEQKDLLLLLSTSTDIEVPFLKEFAKT